MKSSRRDFLQRSATAAAALTVGSRAAHALSPSHHRVLEDASVRAFEEKMIQAHPIPLGSVRVTRGPLKTAQVVTAKYLLSLEPDRMLAYYRVRAGLPQNAEPYGGWDAQRECSAHWISAVVRKAGFL